jgi:hypothetical protein
MARNEACTQERRKRRYVWVRRDVRSRICSQANLTFSDAPIHFIGRVRVFSRCPNDSSQFHQTHQLLPSRECSWACSLLLLRPSFLLFWLKLLANLKYSVAVVQSMMNANKNPVFLPASETKNLMTSDDCPVRFAE